MLLGNGPLGLSLLAANNRILVAAVSEGSQSERSGLQKGDLIVELNGQQLGESVTDDDLEAVLAAVPRPLLLGVLVPSQVKKRSYQIYYF